MSKATAIVVLLFLLCYSGNSQTTSTSPTSDTPESRHAAYFMLNRQIYARRQDQGSGTLNNSEEKRQAASKQLHRMIAKEIEFTLAAAKPSASTITAAIAKLQGEITLSAWGPQDTNTPFASVFTLNGIPSAAVAYVVMQGDEAIPDTQPYLKFYDARFGAWQERATAPTLSDFGGQTFSVAQINSGVPGESWFLAWGKPFADSHSTKHVRLYAFDGNIVRTIWQRENLDGGKITTTADTVTLDYFDDDNPSIKLHEVFHVTPNGLLQQ